MWRFQKESNAEAPDLLRRAHELDPNFATAYAHEAYAHYLNVIMGWAEDQDATLARGMKAAETALSIDDKDAIAWFALGRIQMMQGKHDASVAALEKSLALNPSFAPGYHGLGFALALSGRYEEANEMLGKAELVSPRDPMLWAFLVVHAMTQILSEDYEDAVYWARKTLQIPRATGYWPYAVLAAPLAHLGQMDEASAAIASALEQKPDLTLSYLAKTLPHKQPGGLDPWLTGLRKAGLPE
jgi:adenylate cyclase